MKKSIKIPKFGSDVSEVEIAQWFVKKGDIVKKGDTLLEALIDKAVVEIKAEISGKIIEIKEMEGAIVPIGTEIAIAEVFD